MRGKAESILDQKAFSIPIYIEGFLYKNTLWSLTTEYTDCRDVLTPDAGSMEGQASRCCNSAMTLELRRARKRTASNRQLSVMAMTIGK